MWRYHYHKSLLSVSRDITTLHSTPLQFRTMTVVKPHAF